MKNNNKFTFSYSAPSSEERKEIESIRKSYLSQGSASSDKLSLLRALDNKVKNTPKIIALTIGTISTLIFGLGLAMILEWNILLFGIIVSFVGFVFALLTYPIYKNILKTTKKKYSAQILRLSEELLNEKEQ